jgi:hypothetical protein
LLSVTWTLPGVEKNSIKKCMIISVNELFLGRIFYNPNQTISCVSWPRLINWAQGIERGGNYAKENKIVWIEMI